jgi:hypothetical protein
MQPVRVPARRLAAGLAARHRPRDAQPACAPPPPACAAQVEGVRREVGEEVEALLSAVRRKSAELADVEARLTGRLRWGVAMIQARGEAAAKSRAFMWWRWAGLGGGGGGPGGGGGERFRRQASTGGCGCNVLPSQLAGPLAVNKDSRSAGRPQLSEIESADVAAQTQSPPSACCLPRWIASRRRYRRHVEAKLQQRSNLRLAGRALQGWADCAERGAAMQARLRTAVRRMYFVRLSHAFGGGCFLHGRDHVERRLAVRVVQPRAMYVAGSPAGFWQLLQQRDCQRPHASRSMPFHALWWPAHIQKQPVAPSPAAHRSLA